jgi:hypothetical protein
VSIYQRDPAAPGANVGRRRSPQSGSLERAVARFNASEAVRTVAGLSRSLGKPRVSVGAAAGSPSEVRITVAWELCWYQWGVDFADESGPAYPIGKGSEVEQLDRSAREWNGSVGEGGQLTLAGSPMRPGLKRRIGWLRQR